MTEGEIHVFTTRMSVDEYEVVRAYAHFTRRSINDVIVTAVREYMKQQGRPEELDALVEGMRTRFRAVVDNFGER